MFRADAYLDALARHEPAVFEAARLSMAQGTREGIRLYPDAQAFIASPSISIDYAVMETAERVAVVPVTMGWSDVGCWDALHTLSQQDESGNAIGGDVIAIDTEGCLIRTDGPSIATVGVSDLIVVASGGHVLILPRGKSQDVRKIVDALKARAAESGAAT
jgi:mannose-1-phosphate guanylyltransferase/mannose-1-phosphate guanylyltransferase/mannose-6-phosphate isomerase